MKHGAVVESTWLRNLLFSTPAFFSVWMFLIRRFSGRMGGSLSINGLEFVKCPPASVLVTRRKVDAVTLDDCARAVERIVARLEKKPFAEPRGTQDRRLS